VCCVVAAGQAAVQQWDVSGTLPTIETFDGMAQALQCSSESAASIITSLVQAMNSAASTLVKLAQSLSPGSADSGKLQGGGCKQHTI